MSKTVSVYVDVDLGEFSESDLLAELRRRRVEILEFERDDKADGLEVIVERIRRAIYEIERFRDVDHGLFILRDEAEAIEREIVELRKPKHARAA